MPNSNTNLNMVSFGPSIKHPADFELVNVADLMARMKAGEWREQVEAIRAATDAELQKELKQQLPWFVYGIIMGSRMDSNVIQANGIVFDLDNIKATGGRSNMIGIKLVMAELTPFTKYVFESPVDGMKVLIPFSRPVTNRYEYAEIWRYLRSYVHQKSDVWPDKTPDISRCCFVSWDEFMVISNSARPFDVDNDLYQERLYGENLTPEIEEAMLARRKQGAHFVPIYSSGGLNKRASQADNAPKPSTEPDAASASQPEDLTEIQALSAVEYLCQRKIEWHDWSRCGIALYNHFGDRGKRYWMMFASNPHYRDTPENLSQQWDRLQKYPKVTIGTLFWIAGNYGWQNVVPGQMPAQCGIEDFPELIELFGRPADVPLERDKLPQFILDYLDLVGKITDAQDGAKLTAFLPVVAANIGNRVYMYNSGTRHYCNIWAAIIGPSTISRKTTVISQAMKMLKPFKDELQKLTAKERNEQDIELCRVTQARLYNLLGINSNRLLLHMELSAWMQEMNKNYNGGMKQEITDMFDGKDRNIAKMEIDEYVSKPAFSIVGATTEDWFFRELREIADQRSGFLQRFIICIIKNIDLESLRFDAEPSAEYDKQLHDYNEMLSVFRSLKGSSQLHASDYALAYRNKLYTEIMKNIALNGNDPQAAYFSRIFDNYFWRFCIIIHLMKYWHDLREARDGGRLLSWFEQNRVDEETAREAWYLCEYYYANTQPFLASLEENAKLENEKKVIRLMQKNKIDKIAHHKLLSQSRMPGREFRTCMESLIERQAVLCLHQNSGYRNRSGAFYTLNPVLQLMEIPRDVVK